MDNDQEKKMRFFQRENLTVLELMAVLAILGILLTWVLKQFFL